MQAFVKREMRSSFTHCFRTRRRQRTKKNIHKKVSYWPAFGNHSTYVSIITCVVHALKRYERFTLDLATLVFAQRKKRPKHAEIMSIASNLIE